jgi:hypothetical protein
LNLIELISIPLIQIHRPLLCRGPLISVVSPLFRHRPCASRVSVAVEPLPATPRPDHSVGPTPLPHPSLPRGTARGPSPTPRRVAYNGCPITAVPPFFFPLSSSLLSFLGLMFVPADRTAAAAPSSHRCAIVPPFGPRLTSPVPSSSCRTHRLTPRPPELRHRLGTPPHRAIFSAPPSPTVSGENPAAPPCLAQPPSVPRGVPAGCATPRLLAGVGRLGHCATGLGQQCWASG